MPLADDLKQLAEQVRKRQANVRGEEATKQALVLPFLQVLGFDIYDPTIVQPEFIADFAKKKSNGQMEKVDYALHANGVPVIFIECKAVDSPLPTHDAQLARYFNAVASAKLAIITDGVRYRFFTDLSAPNVMDERPFFEFNLLNFKDREVEPLSHYTASELKADQVQKHAQELFFIDKVGGLLSALMRDPSPAFVRFLLNELDLVPGTVTAKVVERFVPIVRAAFAGAVMEITTRGLSQTIAAVVAPPVAPASPPASEAHSESGEATGDLKVVASAEELDLFERVTKIVAQSPAKHAIAHKDNATYFAVNLGRVQRWFLRFYGHGGTKFVVLRASQDALRPALNGFAAKAMSAQETRIDIASGADVDRIAAAVLVAYETEMKRKDTDTGAESP